MDGAKGWITGGIVAVVIGGTGFTISQADIIDNFANETGMSHEQAQKYHEESQDKLTSFSEIGQDFVDSGNEIVTLASSIDCYNYSYEWESSSMDCYAGKSYIADLGSKETRLGNCYMKLGEDLDSKARRQISICISNIDSLNNSYSNPYSLNFFSSQDITDTKNVNTYNKSILQAALDS